MNESAPAPVLPPVPGWERVAAGVLAMGWLVVLCSQGYSPRQWSLSILRGLGISYNGWLAFLEQPGAGLTAQLNSVPILQGVLGGLWLARIAGTPVLMLWSMAVASGFWRQGRGGMLWWAAIAHGVLPFLMESVQHRFLALRGGAVTPWHQDWLGWLDDAPSWLRNPLHLACIAEFILAALVVWFSRKRRQKPSAPDGTAQA
jgi:hypothetical protein